MRIDKPRRMTQADRVLEEVFAKRLILTQAGALWSPNSHVAQELRQAIHAHRPVLVSKIEEADIRVCPSHELHRKSWTWIEGRWFCEVCKKLLKEVS